MMNYFWSFIISLFLFSCSENSERQEYEVSYEFELEATDTLNIFIDSLTSPYPPSLRYLGNNRLAIFNKANYQVNIYDLNSGLLIRKIDFDKEGENGISASVKGAYIHSEDSIFLTNGYGIFLSNGQGKIIQKYKPNTQDNSCTFQVFFQTKDQPILINDTLYCVIYPDLATTNISSFVKRPSVFGLNIKDGKGKFVAFYPSDYRKGIYGNNYTSTFIAKSSSTVGKGIISSYPIGDFVYNIFDGREYFTKSRYIDKIEPVANMEDNVEAHTSFFVMSASYGAFYYDEHQRIYIKVAEMPRTKEDFVNKIWWKKKNLILLNEKLNIIGEVPLKDDNLNVYHCFSTPNGFYITLDSEDNEDKMSFIGFKLKKISK